ncbi:MAG: DUF1552 domain-containing protein [Myxococcota bacterium]
MSRFNPTRRQLLRGAGGFALALPILPSLMDRAAARRNWSIPPRFISLCSQHGGVWTDFMHPSEDALTESMAYAGHQIRRGDLALSTEGDRASLSPVLSGAADRLTPELAAKMNVIRGLDIPFYIAHHRGGHLGNWAANDGNGEDGVEQQGAPTPSIDQVLAWSPRFYDDLSTTLERSLLVSASHSYGWSSPQSQAGEIQQMPAEFSSLALFNRIFVPEEDEESPRPPVVDRVLENYRSLRESNRRLSARDRQRLDEHIERIDELQRRLSVAVSCGDVDVPRQDAEWLWGDGSFHINPELQSDYWALFNDVVVTAFLCGTSRIAVLGVLDHFSTYAGDWHQDVAHQAHLPDGDRQFELWSGNQGTFEGVMLDLIAKLDAVDEGDGSTLLDNTLVQWTQESGPMTHESIDTTIVTAGGAGGCMRTGQYIDYRNTNALAEEEFYQGTPVRLYAGLLHQQFLGSALQLMGLAPEDYELDAGGGYPNLFIGEGRDFLYPESVQNVRGEMLPWLEA